MLKRLKLGWPGGSHRAAVEKGKALPDSPGGVAEGGFRAVRDAGTLLDTPERRKLVRMLRENCPFSEKMIEAWWITPLQELAVRVQDMPAAWAGAFSRPGGFLDLSLMVAVRAVKLVRGMMLPPGGPPEEQAEQTSGWVCAVYWAALFHHLDFLSEAEGGTVSGQPWYPGLAVPAGAWRLRRAAAGRSPVNSVYMASRLLPESGVLWLQRWPGLSDALLTYLRGDKAASGILNSIILDALSGSGSGSTSTPTAVPVHAVGQSADIKVPETTLISPKVSDNDNNPLSSKDNVSQISEPIENVADQYDSKQPESAVLVKADPAVTAAPPSAAVPGAVALLSAFENHGDMVSGAEPVEDGDAVIPLSVDELLGVLDQQMLGDIPAQQDPLSPAAATAVDDSGSGPEEEASGSAPVANGTPETSGGAFFDWLKQSVEDGSLTINEQDSVLHVLAGFVFLISPDCFFKYISTLPEGEHDRTLIQKSFESLNVHHIRNGKGLYHYHKYDAPDKTGRFTKMSGYMILPGIIFKKGRCPPDSILLSPKN